MRLVAIIGPFRAPTPEGIATNIATADALARQVWQLGAFAQCPHVLTGAYYGLLPESRFLAGHLAMLAHMDAGITVTGWEGSEGSRAEVDALITQGKPVFESLDELKGWLISQEKKEKPHERARP